MKKIILICLIALGSTLTMNAQSWTGTTSITTSTVAATVAIGDNNQYGQLHVHAPAAPPSTTSTPNGNLVLSNDDTVQLALTFGLENSATAVYAWIQARDLLSSTTKRSMFLNPNGGHVAIGVKYNSASLLHTYCDMPDFPTHSVHLFSNARTSSTASITKTGVDIQSTGTWNGTGAVNTGLNVYVAGGTTNYAATLMGGNVGVGTSAPSARLHLISTTEQQRVGYDASNYFKTTVGSTGATTLQGVGSGSAYTIIGGDQVGSQCMLQSTSANGTAAGVGIMMMVGNNGATAAMNILNNGNVGIGTPSPGAKLEVQLASSGTALQASDKGISLSTSTVATSNTTHKTSPYLYLSGAIWNGSASTTRGWTFQTVGTSGVNYGHRLAIGSDDNPNVMSLTSTSAGANVGIGITNPQAFFHVTSDKNATYDSSFVVTSGGKVGIGMTGPGAKLEVQLASSGTALQAADKGISLSTSTVATSNTTHKASPYLFLSGSIWNGISTSTRGWTFQTVGTSGVNYGHRLAIGSDDHNDVISITSTIADAYVGIGTTSPQYKLDVQTTNTVTVGINTNGLVQAAGGATLSDKMFKTNIDSLHNALATIHQLMPKSYYFDTLNFNGEGKFAFQSVKQYGFIAQDVEKLLPELVLISTKPAILDTLGNELNPEYKYRSLNYNAFIPILTKGIQELSNENDSLKTKANKQDSLNASLQNQVNQLVKNNTSLQSQVNQLITNDTSLQNQVNQLMTAINKCCNSSQPPADTNPQAKSLSEGVTMQTNVTLTDAQTIVLEQNVPNPFAEQTTINYYLPDNTVKAQMLFYNAQGQLIQTVALTPKGKGALNVFAQDLTNGIYSYTLVMDGKIIETKKMVKQ